MMRPALTLLACGSVLHAQVRPFDFDPLSPTKHGGIVGRPVLPYRTTLLAPSLLRSTNLQSWQQVEPTGSDAGGMHFQRTGPRAFYRMQPLYPAGF